MLCTKSGCNWPSGSGEEEEENVINVYNNDNDDNNDHDAQRTNFDQKSSLEPSAQMS